MSKYRLNLQAEPKRDYSHPVFNKPAAVSTAHSTARKFLKLAASVPFVVAVLYVGSVLYNKERVVPRGVETVQDFYRRYGNPARVETLFVNGRTYYKITGEIPAPLAFPKGNPEYIFDSTGQLTDWTAESGGDAKFVERWGRIPAQSMNIAYFLERFPQG